MENQPASGGSVWEKIQRGVKETERLIGHKEYNLAMVKARQTLECMVKRLSERSGVEGTDLSTLIDQLYQSRAISKTTCEHYHSIRMIGNKAIHEDNANPYDANQAYHMLSQEVYTFANDYSGKRRQSSSSTKSRRRTKKKSNPMILLIPIVLIIALILLIKLIAPDKDTDPTIASPPATTQAATPTTAPPPEVNEALPEVNETSSEATTAAAEVASVYKATSHLNVRVEPSTESGRIGVIEEGATVNFIRAHDDDWAIIDYEGREAYVSRAFLTQ